MPTLGAGNAMDRRRFLAGAAAAVALTASASPLARAFARRRTAATSYGPVQAADANGLRLPAGFTSRVVAVSGVPIAGYLWHPLPDGGATFPTDAGGWILASNSETTVGGGVGALVFDAAGEVIDAYRILDGTGKNCSGGPTPWNTWLSCEEWDDGRVWECDPYGVQAARPLPALGTFVHEAAAVDPTRGHVYLTEDTPDGLLYRFTPDAPSDLSSGVLEAACCDAAGAVTWAPVPRPNGGSADPTRYQVAGATPFVNGEGAWFDRDHLYVTTSGDQKVWRYSPADEVVEVVYDANAYTEPVLFGVDGVVMSPAGDLFVAEDGGDMQVVILAPDGSVAPFAQITTTLGTGISEVTGLAFDPSGTRLYLNSQRGGRHAPGLGITYEVSGPFATARRS